MGDRLNLTRQWYDWLKRQDKFSVPLLAHVNINTFNDALWTLAHELSLVAPSGPQS